MASTGHIFLGNHAVNRTKGSTPTSTLRCDPDLHPVGLDPVVHDRHTLGTTLGGSIPECTHVRGAVPSLITSHGGDYHLGNQTTMAHSNVTQGMARSGHILFGNREIT